MNPTPGFYWATNPATMVRWIVVEVVEVDGKRETYLPGSAQPVPLRSMIYATRVEGPVMAAGVLATPYTDLGLSVRAMNCLQNVGALTVGAIVALSDRDLLRVNNLGVTTLKEIRAAVARVSVDAATKEAP